MHLTGISRYPRQISEIRAASAPKSQGAAGDSSTIQAHTLVSVAIVVVGVATFVALISSWLNLPGVPTDVTESVRSEHVRILSQARDTSPGNDWEDSYAFFPLTRMAALSLTSRRRCSRPVGEHTGAVQPLYYYPVKCR